MKKCRVGDLVVIINSKPELEENLGRLATVIAEDVRNERDWIIKASHGSLLGFGRLSGKMKYGDIFGAWDCDLMPLRPDEAKTLETQKEVTA